MAIYAIGDLHLSFNADKPMNVFGEKWQNYENKIKKDWMEKVKENDLVILLGDFSWATYLKQSYEDFLYLDQLPGKKIMLKGNHDYWWTTITNMKNFLKEKEISNIEFLQNNCFEFENIIIAGTRGWNFNDSKIFNREVMRLENSLEKAVKLNMENKEIITCMHYPPITKSMLEQNIKSQFIDVMKKYNVKKCFYGHLHAQAIDEKVEGILDGIEFRLLSADAVDFKLYKIQ